MRKASFLCLSWMLIDGVDFEGDRIHANTSACKNRQKQIHIAFKNMQSIK